MALELQIQEVMGDFARGNLFEVEIPFLGETFKFHCRATNQPLDQVEPIKIGYQNRKIGIAGDRDYAEWIVTVYVDEEQKIRKQFIDWSELLHAHGREISGSTPENYKKIAYVKQYARDGETITNQIKISGIFPTNIAEIALDWDANNEVEVFDVSFNVDFWEVVE